MADVQALLARLGATDRVARELIEIGEPALEAVDAFAADPVQRRELRVLASRIAHEIRARAMRAPAAPPDARPPLGDGFWSRHTVEDFTHRLLSAGAETVAIEHDTIVVTLPGDPDARARLLAIYDAETEALGEGFGGDSEPGQLQFWWD